MNCILSELYLNKIILRISVRAKLLFISLKRGKNFLTKSDKHKLKIKRPYNLNISFFMTAVIKAMGNLLNSHLKSEII